MYGKGVFTVKNMGSVFVCGIKRTIRCIPYADTGVQVWPAPIYINVMSKSLL